VSDAATEIEPDRDRDGVKFTLVYACDSCILAGTDDDWDRMGVTDAELDAAEARTRLALAKRQNTMTLEQEINRIVMFARSVESQAETLAEQADALKEEAAWLHSFAVSLANKKRRIEQAR
jgi:hypothetical protein